MERIVELNLNASKEFKLCLDRFREIFSEICSIENGELSKSYLASEVPHFLKIFEGQRGGLDRRMEMIFNFHHALDQLENFIFPSSIKNQREIELRYQFNELTQTYFKLCIDLSVKYKPTPLEYYECLVKEQFEKRESHKPAIFYSQERALRFLKDGRIVIIPLLELLDRHLSKGMYRGLGKITVLQDNTYNIEFRREYTIWMGVGKDDRDATTLYRFDPDTLQIDVIKREE